MGSHRFLSKFAKLILKTYLGCLIKVTIRCENIKQKEVVIPADVEYVSESAFVSCSEVHIINLFPEYVITNLAKTISLIFSKICKGWSNDYYTPLLPVYNFNLEIIREAIDRVISRIKNDDIKVQIRVIEAETVAQMAIAKSKGYDVASLYNLPITPDEETLKNFSDYGILIINGINRENYESLGQNFDYNLIKYYTFLGYNISRRWFIIMGSSIRLEPSDTISAFGPSCCCMKSPKEYLEYMKSIGRLVD